MSLRSKIEDLEFKLESFEMNSDDKQYSERYADYLGDHDHEFDHGLSANGAPMGFDEWFATCEKEDDDEYNAVLELRDELLDCEYGMDGVCDE